jgi:hypothetical protein
VAGTAGGYEGGGPGSGGYGGGSAENAAENGNRGSPARSPYHHRDPDDSFARALGKRGGGSGVAKAPPAARGRSSSHHDEAGGGSPDTIAARGYGGAGGRGGGSGAGGGGLRGERSGSYADVDAQPVGPAPDAEALDACGPDSVPAPAGSMIQNMGSMREVHGAAVQVHSDAEAPPGARLPMQPAVAALTPRQHSCGVSFTRLHAAWR